MSSTSGFTSGFASKMVTSCAVAALAIGFVASDAQAGSFGLREQSATGQGLSFAGAAAGGAGLGSMFWNPAAMTDYKGIQVEGTISGIFPFAKLTTDSTSSLSTGKTSGDIAQDVALPATYGTWQVGKDVWLGLSVNAPFGLATKYDPTWGTGLRYGTTTRATSMEVTPSLAYQINDQLSVGVGVRVMSFKAIYKSFISRPGGLEGDGTGIGASAGLTYKPDNKTEIGIGYRSTVQQDLTGSFTHPNASFPYSVYTNTPIKLRVMLPDSVTVGVKRKLTDQWTVLAGYEWTNWSRIQFPVFYSQATGTRISSLPLGYKDGWMASLGLEYAMNPNWTLRSGVAYEYSPIRDDTRGPRLPDNDRFWLSLGAGYKFDEKLSFDFSYTHIIPQNTRMNVVSGNPSFTSGTYTGKFDSHIDIVSVSMRYRFDTPAAPAALPKK